MDPVTAIGIVSAALSFVTFSTSLVKGAIQIHGALRSDEAGSHSREFVIAQVQRFASRLRNHLSAPETVVLEDRDLLYLAFECRAVSD
ncbi:hypothetical protein B0T26DRAFT_725381 [Lasiosphaeria miniovina]|uniref:Uncharacterized protein n=1 Tax=Lasiosphaeria miniovina TaxID=1954250 RepID=A0AA39ZYS8_9PEZI|nr:uncharacterized protein B0T26DRAFT_725381 [Lasiosphaeria miniovina]KAK0706080.1 hypothetical protein B0T26DRAFT_725381 [Lasiosphaeria miniovina]